MKSKSKKQFQHGVRIGLLPATKSGLQDPCINVEVKDTRRSCMCQVTCSDDVLNDTSNHYGWMVRQGSPADTRLRLEISFEDWIGFW